MIGADLEGADLESRVASLTASATSDDAAAVRHAARARNRRRDRQRRPRGGQGKEPGTITIRATGETQPAPLGQLFVPERTGPLGDHAVHAPADAGAVGGGCSGI